MPTINIDRFKGIIPREDPINLQPGFAEIAENCRLNHGTLRPWREPKLVHQVPSSAQTIYQWGCCWYAWDACVDVTEWKAGCPRLYVTGSAPFPVMATINDDCSLGSDCCPGWQRVGVPDPYNAPTASPQRGVVNDATRKNTAYLYTYQNCLCEEGPPSYLSNEIETNEGTPCLVSGFVAPDPEWCVTTINIYRRETGAYTGNEAVPEHLTDYFLVGQVPVGTTEWMDTVATRDIGPALSTRDHAPPPAGLQGITTIFAGNVMAGFIGNELWFSAAGQPWNWPESQMMALDDNIVAIRSSTNNILHVTTDGATYAVQADAGCNEKKCRTVVKHMEALPAIVCCSSRGSVVTPSGTVFVSSRGLVLMNGVAQPIVLSSPWFAIDDWRQLKPETMRLGYYAGNIFCVSDTYAFVLTLDDRIDVKWDSLKLSTITDRPRLMYTGRNGEMFMLDAGRVLQWDVGQSLRPYTWKSRLIESAAYCYMAGGRVHSNAALNFTMYASDRAVYTRIVFPDKQFRMPMYAHHLMHGFKLEGIAEVRRVHLATSYMDLADAQRSN